MRALNTRMNRAGYWLALGVLVALYAAANFFGNKHTAVSEGVLLFLCVPRLHDIGLSGWWFGGAVLMEIVVVVGSLILLPLSEFTIPAGLFVLAAGVALIWLGMKRGDPNANRFGEPPAPGLSWGKKVQSALTDPRT